MIKDEIIKFEWKRYENGLKHVGLAHEAKKWSSYKARFFRYREKERDDKRIFGKTSAKNLKKQPTRLAFKR